MNIYQRHAEFELRGLFARFGYFNLFVLGMLPFWLPIYWMPSCRDKPLGVEGEILSILLVAAVAIGLESIDRIRRLNLSGRDRISSVGISLIRNLTAFPLFFVWVTLPHARLFYLGLIVACLPWIWISRLLIYPERPATPEQHWWAADYAVGAGIYIVCLLVVSIMMIPNFIGTGGCGGVSSVKGNMHTFQTLVESYALGHGGKYPQQLAELRADGEKHEYWKDLSNRWGKKSERCKEQQNGMCAYLLWSEYPENMSQSLPAPYRFSSMIGLPIRIPPGSGGVSDWAGLILYDPVSPTRYYIYGTDKKGLIIRDKGQPFFLTNS